MLKAEDYADVPIHTEDHATVLLRFDNGNKGSVTVSQVSAGRKNRLSLEISGAISTLSWCSESPNELWIGHRDQANEVMLRDPALFYPEAAALVAYPGGHNEGFPDTSKQLFKEVYADILAGKSNQPLYPTFADGYRELLLCEKIVESNKKESWIEV
jgi:predicted dehydrogenase